MYQEDKLLAIKMQPGYYKKLKYANEVVKSYVPLKLEEMLKMVDVDLKEVERLNFLLGKVDAVCDILPNSNLFIYLHIRKEALLSSQIEGTQSSLIDVFSYENYNISSTPFEDVEQVTNYIKALNEGIEKINGGKLPLCNRLLRELHKTLMNGARGANKKPGEFRVSQNWIGGTRPGNAIFVPPPADHIGDLMSDLERFIHSNINIPDIIKIALIHAQFETIHPFLDGNGRLGRLLITMLLSEFNMVKIPILYVSYNLKLKQQEYYFQLQNYRKDKDGVNSWVKFFLSIVKESAKDVFKNIIELEKRIKEDKSYLQSMGSSYKNALKIYNIMTEKTVVSMPYLAKNLDITLHTVIRGVSQLEGKMLIKEISGKKSEKLYCLKKYVEF